MEWFDSKCKFYINFRSNQGLLRNDRNRTCGPAIPVHGALNYKLSFESSSDLKSSFKTTSSCMYTKAMPVKGLWINIRISGIPPDTTIC